MLKKLIGLILIIIAIYFVYQKSSAQGVFKPLPKRVSSEQITQTSIMPYMEQDIVSGENVIYCSAFQIAWDMLGISLMKIKEPVKVSGSPLIADMLNKRMVNVKDIPIYYYLSAAGFGKDGVERRVVAALDDKFDDTPGMNIFVDKENLLVYASSLKEIEFEHKFEDLGMMLKFNSIIAVKAFGIGEYTFGKAHSNMSDQVHILDYKNEDDFVIRLKPKVKKEEFVLAKVTPRSTLLETIEYVMKRADQPKFGILKEGETLQIPKIHLNIMHRYLDLDGYYLLNEGFEDYFIAKNGHSIRFNFDDEVVPQRPASRFKAEVKDFSQLPRKFIFNKPFLIYAKFKRSKYPYFAIWVGNANVLMRE